MRGWIVSETRHTTSLSPVKRHLPVVTTIAAGRPVSATASWAMARTWVWI